MKTALVTRTRAAVLAVALCGSRLGGAAAAPQPPRGPAAATPALVAEGTVARHLTTPYGDANGLRLADGTLVLFAPHLGARIGSAAAPGARIRVIGNVAADGAIRAVAVVNLASGATIDDEPPGAPVAPPTARPALQRLEVAGAIDLVLHGPRGEANGVILVNGGVIYFRPDLVRTRLARGQPFAAIGIGTRGAAGVTIEAIATSTDLEAARAAARVTPTRPAPPPPGPAPVNQP